MFMWFQSNPFSLNLDKTKMTKFIPTSLTSYPLYTFFLNKMVEVVETIKCLYLQLDNLYGTYRLIATQVEHCCFFNERIILYIKY
jgi:hypothetical protein